jgi:hypothetical protein
MAARRKPEDIARFPFAIPGNSGAAAGRAGRRFDPESSQPAFYIKLIDIPAGRRLA